MTYAEVTLKAANRDLHSGLFGGSALNPINALTRILGDLQDGRPHPVSGFYDGVKPVSNAQRAQWDALGSTSGVPRDIGLTGGGRARLPALERLWARPTADINGIWGGYTGAGSKTVIASEAWAKVSFRLVPNQDPDGGDGTVQTVHRRTAAAGCDGEFEDFTRGPGHRGQCRQSACARRPGGPGG